MGQVVLADDDFDVDTERIGGSEDFDDAADGIFTVFEKLGVDDEALEFRGLVVLPCFDSDAVVLGAGGRQRIFDGDFDPVLHAGIVGDDPEATFGDAEFADDGGVGAAHDLVDFAFRFSAGADAADADEGAVTVHGAFERIAVEVDVADDAGDGFIGDEEAETVAVDGDAAGGEVAGEGGGLEVAVADFDEVAGVEESFEGVFEEGTAVALGAEVLIKLLEAGFALGEFEDMREDRGGFENYGCSGTTHSSIIVVMRLLLIFASTLTLFAQPPMATQNMVAQNTPAPAKKTAVTVTKAAAPAPAVKNYKLTGSPAAPITIEVYTDYECPSCRNLYLQTLPDLITQYVATGKVQLLHRDFPLPMHKHTKLATRYANAAGQVGKYDLVAGQIFKSQGDWAQNGNIDAEVAKVVSPADMVKIRELVKSDTHLDDTVTVDVAMGNKDGLNQTPTLIVVSKGKRQKIDGMVPFGILKSYIDQLLAKN